MSKEQAGVLWQWRAHLSHMAFVISTDTKNALDVGQWQLQDHLIEWDAVFGWANGLFQQGDLTGLDHIEQTRKAITQDGTQIQQAGIEQNPVSGLACCRKAQTFHGLTWVCLWVEWDVSVRSIHLCMAGYIRDVQSLPRMKTQCANPRILFGMCIVNQCLI